MSYFSDLDIINKSDPYRLGRERPYEPPATPEKCWINSYSSPHCYFNCAAIDTCPVSTKTNGTGRHIRVDGIIVWEAKPTKEETQDGPITTS